MVWRRDGPATRGGSPAILASVLPRVYIVQIQFFPLETPAMFFSVKKAILFSASAALFAASVTADAMAQEREQGEEGFVGDDACGGSRGPDVDLLAWKVMPRVQYPCQTNRFLSSRPALFRAFGFLDLDGDGCPERVMGHGVPAGFSEKEYADFRIEGNFAYCYFWFSQLKGSPVTYKAGPSFGSGGSANFALIESLEGRWYVRFGDWDGDGDDDIILLEYPTEFNQEGDWIIQPLLNPAEPCSAELDSDGDGVNDCIDKCPLNARLVEPSFQCGCLPTTDYDGDGYPECGDSCTGDLTLDLEVGGGDLGMFLALMGTSSPVADFDSDGEVDGGDLGLLLLNWGPCS